MAEALRQQGNQIVYVGCGRQFKSYCIAMSACGLKFDSPEKEKEKICQKCERNKAFIRKEFGLNGPDIAEELSLEDVRQIVDVLKDVTPENYLALNYLGIEVGRLTLYEFLLNHKKNNLEIDPDKWPEYKAALRNSIFSALASQKIISREKPDRLITYNSFYSVNHVCCITADKHSVPHYLLHAGNNMAHRMETLTLSKGYSYNFITRSPLWGYYRSIPCSSEQLGIVTNHLITLFDAKSPFIYSAPKSKKKVNLREKFGIATQQKVLVATMSSHDERFAAVTIGVMPPECSLVFPTQIDWIDALSEFVAGRPELFLIIRVHPRELPNKRESVTSEYASKLKARLINLPNNVKVNWPSDQISLYDIADIADAFLNSRSTTGMEMSLLGIPVVLYSPGQLYAYPPDLNYTADSKEDYFLQIDRALSNGWNIEFSRKAYRWGVFQYCRALLDISESYGGVKPIVNGFVGRVVNKVLWKLSPNYQQLYQQMQVQKQDCRHRAKKMKSGKTINDYLESGKDSIIELDGMSLESVSLEQETDALKHELRRIYAAMCWSGANIEPDTLRAKIHNFINFDRNS